MSKAGKRDGRRMVMGRGLSALLGESDAAPIRRVQNIPIEHIRPREAQPRRAFPEAEMAALSESIREYGVLQPVILRRIGDSQDRFEIIAGERRWRAAQLARIHELPAVIRESGDREASEIALIENIQRSDLTPIEEAQGYQNLIREFGHGQDVVARIVGKSRSYVANALRLLSLPPGAKAHLEAGRLTAGHARTVLGASNPDRLADRVVADNLSVRDTERLVQAETEGRRTGRKSRRRQKDADVRALERSLREALGLSVDIAVGTHDRGRLTIHYQSLEQLDSLLERLTGTRQPGAHA